jgi:hypothetical protein
MAEPLTAPTRGFHPWLQRRLTNKDSKGNEWPAGGGRGQRWKDPDGTELALIAQGQAFDVYIGREPIHNVTLTAKTAVSLAWWLIRWWISCWFGLKLWLWDWSISKTYDRWLDDEAPTQPSGLDRAPPKP